jgi:hypothetical protein
MHPRSFYGAAHNKLHSSRGKIPSRQPACNFPLQPMLQGLTSSAQMV